MRPPFLQAPLPECKSEIFKTVKGVEFNNGKTHDCPAGTSAADCAQQTCRNSILVDQDGNLKCNQGSDSCRLTIKGVVVDYYAYNMGIYYNVYGGPGDRCRFNNEAYGADPLGIGACTRKVTVLDIEAPAMTLLGPAFQKIQGAEGWPVCTQQGQKDCDKGATANDLVDGFLAYDSKPCARRKNESTGFCDPDGVPRYVCRYVTSTCNAADPCDV